jgi:hypothetical protein
VAILVAFYGKVKDYRSQDYRSQIDLWPKELKGNQKKCGIQGKLTRWVKKIGCRGWCPDEDKKNWEGG